MQVCKIIILFACIFLALEARAQNASRFDVAGLGNASGSPSPSPTPVEPKKKVENKSKAVANDEKLLDAKAQKDLVATIDSLTLILKQTGPGPARNQILINRATALNRYGRQRVMTQKTYALTDEIKRYFNLSLKDAEEVITAKESTKDQKLRAHDVAGTSLLYLEQDDKAREHFLAELKMNPPAEKAGRIGLMIAEQYFDQGNFKEAINFYTTYYPKMIPQWKELAIYKLGWCMINQNLFDQAENYFIKIAHSKSVSGIGRDAIRDLAYITSSKLGSVPHILETEKKIGDLNDRITYLSDARAVLEGLNFVPDHLQIVDHLLTLEKDPVKQLEFLLANLRMQKKQYANIDHFNAFTKIITVYTKSASKYSETVEVENENIFKAFVDTYLGRVKSLDNPPMTPEQMLADLLYMVQAFQKNFKDNAHFQTIVDIWENISLDTKNWDQVDQMTQVILSDQTRFKTSVENAYLNQIAALDQLNRDPERRALRVKEFVEKFPNSSRWLSVAKIYGNNLVNSGHFKEALPTLNLMSEKEPGEESFYQLQYARYKLQDYQAVVKDERNKSYTQPTSKVLELYRESSLKLAEAAKASSPEQYRARIEEFIKLSTDPAKARIARIDYFNYLLKNNFVPDAYQKFLALPVEERSLADYESFRDDLYKLLIDQGNFDSALKIANTKQRIAFAEILTGRQPSVAELDALSPKERNYFLGLFSLLKPSEAIQYLKRNKATQDENTKELLVLAYKVKLNQWRLVRSPELEAALGKDYSFTEKVSLDKLSVEKAIADVPFPNLSKMSPARQAKVVQGNIVTVQSLRQRGLKAIGGKPPEVQVRVLDLMKGLEQKMGEYLMSAPMPAGLTPEQTEQYKTGIKSAADEFFEQNKQFEILAKKAQEEVAKSSDWMNSRLFAQPDMSKWVWPDGAAADLKLQPIFRLAKNGNHLGALVLLDYLRSTAIKTDEAFFEIRSGLILYAKPNDALRVYLLDELEKSKQTIIIKNWARIINRPYTETPPQ